MNAIRFLHKSNVGLFKTNEVMSLPTRMFQTSILSGTDSTKICVNGYRIFVLLNDENQFVSIRGYFAGKNRVFLYPESMDSDKKIKYDFDTFVDKNLCLNDRLWLVRGKNFYLTGGSVLGRRVYGQCPVLPKSDQYESIVKRARAPQLPSAVKVELPLALSESAGSENITGAASPANNSDLIDKFMTQQDATDNAKSSSENITEATSSANNSDLIGKFMTQQDATENTTK